MKFVNNKKYVINYVIFISTFFIFFFIQLANIDHLLVKNRFTEIDSRIPGGIKVSIDEGLTSYGMLDVGLSIKNKEYTGFSLEKNIYDKVELVNTLYLETNQIYETSSFTSYKKLNGFYTRVLPFALYKFTSLFSYKFIYLQLTYISLSLFAFFKIYLSIQKKFGITKSLIFYLCTMTNPFFYTYVNSFVSPFFISIFPILILTNQRIRKKIINEHSIFLITITFLLPSLVSNTVGPLVLLSFITGLFLFSDDFKFYKNKLLLAKSAFIGLASLFVGEVIWISQRFFILKEKLDDLFAEFFSSFAKYNLAENINILNYSQKDCADISSADFLNYFFNLKMNDFIFFEVNLIHYFIIFLLFHIYLYIKTGDAVFSTFKENSNILLILLTYFLWFFLIKGAFSCHLHVYPRYFLIALIPSLVLLKKGD